VFVAMATFLRNEMEPSGALDQLARLSYEYFNRRATVSEYGRPIR
jgi:hypothetical protein